MLQTIKVESHKQLHSLLITEKILFYYCRKAFIKRQCKFNKIASLDIYLGSNWLFLYPNLCSMIYLLLLQTQIIISSHATISHKLLPD
jgi:hypothetical protein